MHTQTRSISIDALRGAAILMMILSGVIPFGGALPAWMYHAQVPPPEHVFRPEAPGITWVDLVFPFFLFAMGAAVPYALPGRLGREGLKPTMLHIAKRYLLLLLFAVISFNMAPLRIPQTGSWANYIGIAAYTGLFLAFVQYPGLSDALKRVFRMAGWGILAALGAVLHFHFNTLNPAVNDSIIRVLANVYLAGSLIWLLTRQRPLLRAGITLLVLAFYLGDLESGSWVSRIWRWSDPWNLVSPFLLKYLLLFIPGTLAGDWLIAGPPHEGDLRSKGLLSAIAALVTGVGLWSLFVRQVDAGFGLTLLLLAGGMALILSRRAAGPLSGLEQLFLAGSLLLLAGYLCDPFQGGIKKDHSTLSYFLVTGGLASLWACAFEETASGFLRSVWMPIARVGQNALMAYLIAGFFLVPLLLVSGIGAWFGTSVPMLVFKAVLITAMAGGITAYLTKKHIYWKL